MKEVRPGIYEVEDGDEIKAIGYERVIDYDAINFELKLESPKQLIEHLKSHNEFMTGKKSVVVATIDSHDILKRVYWYQGQHYFPKEDLEADVQNHKVVYTLIEQGLNKRDATSVLNAMLPTVRDSDLYDFLWYTDGVWGSYLCAAVDCCPPPPVY